eukprot:534328-Pelagomonas_calceolata.AAC.4
MAHNPAPLDQQSLGDKRLAKNQTLGYINGYQREDALREVRDLPPRDATATASPTQQQSPEATGTFGHSKSGMFADSPSKLPQWVENDRKVGTAACHFGPAGSSNMIAMLLHAWQLKVLATQLSTTSLCPLCPILHAGPAFLWLLQGRCGGEQHREPSCQENHPVLLLRGWQHACGGAKAGQQRHSTGK